MEQETIAQTMLDQLVTDENSQMLKALIPYLSFSGQRILAAYAKTQELCNTLQLFSRPQNDMQICSSRPMNPMELLNDIRKFSYGENRKKLEKEATKILSKYKRNRNTTVTRIDTDKFHFIKPEE